MELSRLCARCRAELEQGDLRCPVCALAVPMHRRVVDRVEARIVRCGSCGASLSWVAEASAPKCAFCDSVMEVELQKDPLEQAEFFLPFAVGEDKARAALGAFLGRRSFFRPSDLASASTLDSLRALWWPAWIFNARALISWTADSNAGARRADWAPHSGAVQERFEQIAISASRGLTSQECASLIPKYLLGSRRSTPEGPEGAQVERFDVNRSGARKAVHDAIAAEAEARVRPHVPGTRIRKLRTAVLLEGLDTDRYALPAYVLAYRYRGRLYRVVVHGQDATCLIGKAPISGWKVLLAILGSVVGAAIVGALLALVLGR